jgi:hypothetical protein
MDSVSWVTPAGHKFEDTSEFYKNKFMIKDM